MDIVNWWLGWPTLLQDASIVLALLLFLSHAPRVAGWNRGGRTRTT
ncbi:MAG: hypothetical protein KGJ86_00810 [Chloroflexota bacterium]|nr:hypothetical protein [Chloroflexota bacterium]